MSQTFQQIAQAERYFRGGQTELAEDLLRQVIARDKKASKAYELLAYVCGNRGELDECERLLLRASALPQCSPETFFYLGKVQLQRKQPREALKSIQRSLRLAGEYFEALHEMGVAHAELREHEPALQSFLRAERKNPHSPELLSNIGNTLSELQRYGEALQYYDRALKLNAQSVRTWTDRGHALTKLERGTEALESYEHALAIDPEDAETWMNRATTLMSLRRQVEALAALEEVERLAPDTDYLGGYVLHTKMHLCRWQDWSSRTEDLLARVDAGEKASIPFALMATPAPLASLLACARTFAADDCPPRVTPAFKKKNDPVQKLRLGYFSSDFRNHATSQLMAGLFECHDRSRFELFAFSFGRPVLDGMRARVAAAFDHFMDVGDRTDRDVAAMAREAGLHIAVDLHGFTQGYRANIFAERAAPIQVNYLGFPGTMGCKFMDYIIADSTLVHPDEYGCYSEKVVILPGSYQANDNAKRIGDSTPSRESLGLPAHGFVFASFNNNYKITPDAFDVWMRLLRDVPGSVLWLLKTNDQAQIALEGEARSRGVEPHRIVWAERMGLPEHLARHAHADLFLDTFHYNAHTTCSDALWGGLPVLTLAGSTFASRVSASLLNAVGMPDLITGSVEEYETLARTLSTSPQRLAEIRGRLQDNRTKMPLFDTPRFAKGIEAAFDAMWERYRRGLAPDHIQISDQEACPIPGNNRGFQ